jgi:glycosyltransferase involved in cell wall biosynthesis
MKILIASDLHAPVLNGVATFSRNLALGMASRGHEVVVIAPSQDGKKSIEHDTNHTVYRVRSTVFPLYQNVRISPTPQLEVRKIIQDFQPDIIHIQMPMWIGMATMNYAKRCDIPVVSTSHAMPENLMDNIRRLSKVSRPINRMLADHGRRFHNRADAITSPTLSGIKSFGKQVDKVTKPVHIISNGINLDDFQPGTAPKSIYKKYGLPTDRPIITYIGRVDAEKHLWVLLKAMRRMLHEGHNAHLLIVGAGVDLTHMQQLSKELGIDAHTTFAGRVPEEDKIALEHVGTVFAISSPAELQSIVTLEAMASGQPVVAVDAGALAELCHDGENGYLFALDDDEGMAEGIVAIITDKKRREKFAKESLRIAGTHDLRTTLKEFEKLYRKVVRDKKREIATRPSTILERVRSFAEN